MRSVLLVLALSVSLPAAAQPGASALADARAFFDTYVRLEGAFDAALVDLYAPAATIRNTRRLPDGTTRVLTLTTAQLRQMLPQALPVARQRGDTNSYTNIAYAVEGVGVRITATRYAHLKGYYSPVSMLIRPSAAGAWQIVEELSESQP